MQWLRLEPHASAPDPARADRLGEIVETREDTWIVLDGEGERHAVDDVRRRVLADDLREPTWIVQRPIPTYGVGDRLVLGWRMRNRGTPEQRRPDRLGIVVVEDAPTVTVEDDAGERHAVNRVNGHELSERHKPRWVIVGRPLVRPTPILHYEYLRAHHDVPRLVTFEVDDRRFALECPFDEARRGFLPTYDVYELVGDGRRLAGRVLVDAVGLDETHHRFIDVESLGL